MAVRVLDGSRCVPRPARSSVHFLPLALAIGCHLLKLACTSRAWRNVLAAAYPDERVPVDLDLRRVPRRGRHQRDRPRARR